MKICLIGLNITNLILASVFSKKNLPVHIYQNNKIQRFKTKRTIAISAENFGFLKKISNANLQSWKTNEIKIYLENENSREIINFKNHNKESFNLIKYSDLNNDENFDIVFLYKKFSQIHIQLFFFRSGKNLGNKDFFLSEKLFEESETVLRQFLIFFYKRNTPPQEILLNFHLQNTELIKKVIS